MAKFIEPMDYAPATGVPAGITARGEGTGTWSTLSDSNGVPAGLSALKLGVSSSQSSSPRGFSLNAAGTFGDGQIFTRTRGDKAAGVLMRGAGTSPTLLGYKATISSTALSIYGGATTLLGSVPFSVTSAYYYYNILAEAVGNVIRAMAWKEGDPMPSDWMLSVVDNAYTSGYWGGYTTSYNFSRFWDEIGIANGGDVLFAIGGGRVIQSPTVGSRLSRGSGIQSSQRRIIAV